MMQCVKICFLPVSCSAMFTFDKTKPEPGSRSPVRQVQEAFSQSSKAKASGFGWRDVIAWAKKFGRTTPTVRTGGKVIIPHTKINRLQVDGTKKSPAPTSRATDPFYVVNGVDQVAQIPVPLDALQGGKVREKTRGYQLQLAIALWILIERLPEKFHGLLSADPLTHRLKMLDLINRHGSPVCEYFMQVIQTLTVCAEKKGQLSVKEVSAVFKRVTTKVEDVAEAHELMQELNDEAHVEVIDVEDVQLLKSKFNDDKKLFELPRATPNLPLPEGEQLSEGEQLLREADQFFFTNPDFMSGIPCGDKEKTLLAA